MILGGIFQYLLKLGVLFHMPRTNVLCYRFIEWSPHVHKLETIPSYLTRVAQIKEQLEVFEDNVEERELWWLPWMVSLDHGTHSFKQFVQGGWYISVDSKKNVHKKNLDSW